MMKIIGRRTNGVQFSFRIAERYSLNSWMLALDWMACISIDGLLAALVVLGGMYEFWRTGRVTGLNSSW